MHLEGSKSLPTDDRLAGWLVLARPTNSIRNITCISFILQHNQHHDHHHCSIRRRRSWRRRRQGDDDEAQKFLACVSFKCVYCIRRPRLAGPGRVGQSREARHSITSHVEAKKPVTTMEMAMMMIRSHVEANNQLCRRSLRDLSSLSKLCASHSHPHHRPVVVLFFFIF